MANKCRCPRQRSHSVFVEQSLCLACGVVAHSFLEFRICVRSYVLHLGMVLRLALSWSLHSGVCVLVEAYKHALLLSVCVCTSAYTYRYLLGMLVSDEGVPLTLAQLTGIIRRMFAAAAGFPCSVKLAYKEHSTGQICIARYGSFVHPMHRVCACSLVKLMFYRWDDG